MARLTNQQAEKLTTTGGSYFQLKDDGDHAKVQILVKTTDDVPVYSIHKVKIGDKWANVSCLREADDPVEACPFCHSGMKREVQWYVPLFDLESQTVKIWSRGKSIVDILRGFENRYSPLDNIVVDIERHGKAGNQQTKYQIYPLPTEQPYDVSQIEVPEIEGSVLMVMTYDEMLAHLNDAGYSDDSVNIRPRGSAPNARADVPASQPLRRTPAGQAPKNQF